MDIPEIPEGLQFYFPVMAEMRDGQLRFVVQPDIAIDSQRTIWNDGKMEWSPVTEGLEQADLAIYKILQGLVDKPVNKLSDN
jgi:hypothetical protein